MISLVSDTWRVRLDPAHGGEILDLIDLSTGRQLLGRPPFIPSAPQAGDLTEDEWTRSYRGGWQALAPNAGNACVVNGVRHGFHGQASVGYWEIEAEERTEVHLRWAGHGLHLRRSISLRGEELAVETEMSSLADRTETSFLFAEHIAFGHEMLAPKTILLLPGGRAYEMDEANGPLTPPEDALPWPQAWRLDGTAERADRWNEAEPQSRLSCVADLPEGRAALWNPVTETGVEIHWDIKFLPYLWLWKENCSLGGLWQQQGQIWGIEPSSVPHHLGLANAIRASQAHCLKSGESRTCRIRVRPFSPLKD